MLRSLLRFYANALFPFDVMRSVQSTLRTEYLKVTGTELPKNAVVLSPHAPLDHLSLLKSTEEALDALYRTREIHEAPTTTTINRAVILFLMPCLSFEDLENILIRFKAAQRDSVFLSCVFPVCFVPESSGSGWRIKQNVFSLTTLALVYLLAQRDYEPFQKAQQARLLCSEVQEVMMEGFLEQWRADNWEQTAAAASSYAQLVMSLPAKTQELGELRGILSSLKTRDHPQKTFYNSMPLIEKMPSAHRAGGDGSGFVYVCEDIVVQADQKTRRPVNSLKRELDLQTRDLLVFGIRPRLTRVEDGKYRLVDAQQITLAKKLNFLDLDRRPLDSPIISEFVSYEEARETIKGKKTTITKKYSRDKMDKWPDEMKRRTNEVFDREMDAWIKDGAFRALGQLGQAPDPLPAPAVPPKPILTIPLPAVPQGGLGLAPAPPTRPAEEIVAAIRHVYDTTTATKNEDEDGERFLRYIGHYDLVDDD
jgi:hypothetical protein